MTGDDYETIVRWIETRAGVALEQTKVEWAGAESQGFRLADVEVGTSFAIGLELIPRKAEAFLVMDRYAGAAIRAIESAALSDGTWSDIVSEAATSGLRTQIVVNNMFVELDLSAAGSPWTSLEIECSKRVSRLEAEPLSALREVGLTCLLLVLAVIELDGDQEAANEGEEEGMATHVVSTRYERSPVNRARCIRYYGAVCWVCDFDFGSTYGSIGEGFIEVHHRTPVSEIGPAYRVDPRRDLVPLCSNCHSMIHRKRPPYSPPELRSMLGKPEKWIVE